MKNYKTEVLTAVSEETVVTGLSPYTGTFGYEEAAHLLRRATMGASHTSIQAAVSDGLAATVTQLLTLPATAAPPINYYNDNDTNAPVGSTFIGTPHLSAAAYSRRLSIHAWGMRLLATQPETSIQEKLTLFWHNHFAIERTTVADPRVLYQYITLIRENCLGNFQQLVKDMTINPAMLRYLDGRSNTDNAPNENYAREFLELFTIGKGPQVASGDYTYYTETDILELAKVFTGWRDQGYHSTTIADPYAEYVSSRHDTSSKTLSHRFNNATIINNEENEYKDAVDIVFLQDRVAYFICEKLYRWFVNYDIAAVESTVIEDMAQALIANNYTIAPVLEALFKSAHFYDVTVRGSMIKNPLEYIYSGLRIFGITGPTDILDSYDKFRRLHDFMEELNMQYYAPPNVAGWPAYYLEPQFSELWVNSVTIRARQEFATGITQEGFVLGGFSFEIDVLSFVGTLTNPLFVNDLITEMCLLIYPKDLTQEQKDYLKDILIPGLPDFEWYSEYSNYLSNPNDTMVANAVAERLRNMMEAMLNLSEFHLA